jgi:ABC-type bacteriocin/lantibiotic exporter with double-glycine peptidase domain
LAGEVADDLIWAALAEAKLDVAVRAMDRGLDHPLEEDGSGLSAGQKQRLCLARALLNRPQVLILDEASANLDEATELEIASSLRALRGRCTTILVSHRAGILTYADETVRLGRD